MSKAEFLDKLCQGLRFQTDPDEIRKVVSFYDQSIEDRMEDGMSEEDAVAALGPIDGIIREIREVWAQEAAGRTRDSREAAGGGEESETVRWDFDPAVARRFEIFDISADVRLSPSPDGLVHLEYEESGRWSCEVTDGSVVTIRRGPGARGQGRFDFDIFGMKFTLPKPDLDGLLRKGACVRLLLPAFSPVEVGVNTPFGDLTAERVKLTSLSVKLANGGVQLREIDAEEKIGAATANGDVSVERVSAADIVLSAASGDVELREVSAGGICLNIASGDVDARTISCVSFDVKTASGDVDVEDVDISEKLSVITVSGDMDLKLRHPCRCVELDTTSGDVDLELPGPGSLYTVVTRTYTGRTNVEGNASGGPDLVRVKTLSGDVDVSFRG